MRTMASFFAADESDNGICLHIRSIGVMGQVLDCATFSAEPLIMNIHFSTNVFEFYTHFLHKDYP